MGTKETEHTHYLSSTCSNITPSGTFLLYLVYPSSRVVAVVMHGTSQQQ